MGCHNSCVIHFAMLIHALAMQWLGLPDAAEALLLDGADVSAASSCGTTPMHLAAHGLYMSGRSFSDGCADYQRVITLLHHAGADIDPRDAAGWTPLMIAARHNRPNLVLELLDLGADAKAEDSSGSGLMERATELKQQHRALREYTLTLLKSAGAVPLKVTDAVSSKERWQFGVSGAVWDRGVRLKLHLMGLFLGVSASIRNPRGYWLSVHFNLGKDQWVSCVPLYTLSL